MLYFVWGLFTFLQQVQSLGILIPHMIRYFDVIDTFLYMCRYNIVLMVFIQTVGNKFENCVQMFEKSTRVLNACLVPMRSYTMYAVSRYYQTF